MYIGKEQEKFIKQLVRKSNEAYSNEHKLKPAEPMLIRAGVAGGLPFNSLTTDVVTGCLPESMACYGMCFSAVSSWENGIDFGKRVVNQLDETIFLSDLHTLPHSQKYIRCGWNSDPSWNWPISARMNELARDMGLLMIFITKAFCKMPDNIMQRLIMAEAEVRANGSKLNS
ncbi:hypothetical protein [Xenorhabdus japonica]|uniref:Uncharacterized protein n=1 Tax=Xenorhabdus japonica TaxID=53341 RepID=A0A1I5BA67_9GAMM|nr:hypothetical protein [Xenorhabdus japonica]SFN71618.1 hypothetical protein SAMN05421579_1171 [Xenorhabdus japonica]